MINKKGLMAIFRNAAEEALERVRIKNVGLSEERFNAFAAIVKQALDETEADVLGEDNECKDCAFRDKCGEPEEVEPSFFGVNARLLLIAQAVARKEGKTLGEWISSLIIKKLF